MSLPSCRRQRGSRGDRQGLRRRGRRGYGGSRSVMCPYGTLICHCHLPLASLAFECENQTVLSTRANQSMRIFLKILIINTYIIGTDCQLHVCTVCVLYCPLVSIPSNSSTTEYKLATAISSSSPRDQTPGARVRVQRLKFICCSTCVMSCLIIHAQLMSC